MKINWINSGGGPILCASRSVALQWRGTEGSSIGSVESDYERACGTSHYLESIACGTGEVLVLGDEPMQSAFFQSSGGLLIVRWLSCASHSLAIDALKALPDSLPHIEPLVSFDVADTELFMFDSALAGSPERDSISAGTPSGRVNITTERYEASGRFDFVVHRFICHSGPSTSCPASCTPSPPC